MSSIVVNPKNQREFEFISELLQKLGIDSKVLSDEDSEDIGLSILMKDVDRSEIVPASEIMGKLKAS
ncbi:MAG: hypothetical protein RJQ09_01250 [Cyclobacteriaceae bacterium]